MVLNAKARIVGRHPTDTCTNPIFSGACSTAADLLGDKAAKSIETACNFIRRRQQKVHTYGGRKCNAGCAALQRRKTPDVREDPE